MPDKGEKQRKSKRKDKRKNRNVNIKLGNEFVKKNKGESIWNNRKQKGEFKKIYNKLYENDWYQN